MDGATQKKTEKKKCLYHTKA